MLPGERGTPWSTEGGRAAPFGVETLPGAGQALRGRKRAGVRRPPIRSVALCAVELDVHSFRQAQAQPLELVVDVALEALELLLRDRQVELVHRELAAVGTGPLLDRQAVAELG